MLRSRRSRPLLALLIGSLVPLLALIPGCLRTLDESLINQHDGSATAGSGGSGGSEDNGGSGGRVEAGGTGDIDGAVDADGGTDAREDTRPEAGFTPYDPTQHPVTNLFGSSGAKLVSVDKTTVFVTSFDNAKAKLSSVPLAGGSGSVVTSALLRRPHALVSPDNSLSLYYVGVSSTDNGVIGRFLKNPGGSANPEQPITTAKGFEQAVDMYAASDNYAYVSARATTFGSPRLLRFSLAAGTSTTERLLGAGNSKESGGPITMSQGCIYWISNGAIWTLPRTGGTQAKAALKTQITDAVDIASDLKNFYYTRGTGEVWQRALSGGTCDGNGPAEQPIAWGYQSIGHVVVYGTTVAWGALGDKANGFNGGGIFTTSIGGYDVVQIAPAKNGVDDIAVGPNEIVYSTIDGSVHKVPE